MANDTKTRQKQTEVYECEASPVDYGHHSASQPPNSHRAAPQPLFNRKFAFRLGGIAILFLILGIVLFVKLAGVLLGAIFALLSNPRSLALLVGVILILLLLRGSNSRR